MTEKPIVYVPNLELAHQPFDKLDEPALVAPARHRSALVPVRPIAVPELGLGLGALPRIGAGGPDRVRDLAVLERDLPEEDAAAHPGAAVRALHLAADVVHVMRAAP